MIRGVVISDEARVRFQVIGPGGKKLDVDAIVDTGYTSRLTAVIPRPGHFLADAGKVTIKLLPAR